MALIKCPECGKDVSDKAASCIHCGYPLASSSVEQQRIVKTLSQVASNAASPAAGVSSGFSLFSADNSYVNIECKNCGKVYRYDRSKYFTEVLPGRCTTNTLIRCTNCGNTAPAYSKIIGEKKTAMTKTVETLRCPRCSSTLVTTGQRGFSIWTGFLGSGKTVNRCGKCGHSWQPK